MQLVNEVFRRFIVPPGRSSSGVQMISGVKRADRQVVFMPPPPQLTNVTSGDRRDVPAHPVEAEAAALIPS